MNSPTNDERKRLREWRAEVLKADHVLDQAKLDACQGEVLQWDCVAKLPDDQKAKFEEPLELLDPSGQPTGARAARGLCHWLWLRHGCVHGMCFSPKKLVILQRRALSVADWPAYLDLSFAGHIGKDSLDKALKREGRGEMGLKLVKGSSHIADTRDLEPILSYACIEPPRPQECFYNAEVRFVYGIRLTAAGMGAMCPRDKEAGGFVLLPLAAAFASLRAPDAASALRVSGMHPLYRAVKKWRWSY